MFDNITLKKFAFKFKTLRKATGLNQTQFAIESGLSRSYVGHLERGLRNPRRITLDLIANALKMTYRELVTFE